MSTVYYPQEDEWPPDFDLSPNNGELMEPITDEYLLKAGFTKTEYGTYTTDKYNIWHGECELGCGVHWQLAKWSWCCNLEVDYVFQLEKILRHR